MKLHSQVIGSGPPLILLHGLFGSHQNWQPVARWLSGQFRVHTVDLRNHGVSPHHAEVNYPVMAADVLKFMAHEQISTAHLLGHSLGGKVAMQFALLYPEKIEKLVVVDIAPRAYDSVQDDVFNALRALDVNRLRTRQEADEALTAMIPNRAMRRFLLTNLVYAPEGGLRWRIHLEALYARREQLTAAVAGGTPFVGPTLFIRGGRSDYVRPSDTGSIRKLFPSAQLETIESADHWVQVDAFDEFVTQLQHFLKADQ